MPAPKGHKYTVGNDGGRPTTYKPEYCDRVDEYIKQNQDEYKQTVKYESEKSTGYEQKLTVKLPTQEGFSLMLGVPIETMKGWGRKHQKFSMALKKIHQEQRERLLNMGLSGEYNSTIAKLILSANHGMSEMQEVKNTGEIKHTHTHETNLENYKKAQNIAREFEKKLYNQLKK